MASMPTIPKYFNIAGPCDPTRHYMLGAVERLPDVGRLVDEGHYFVLRSARQSGKTTFLRALAKDITRQGRFHALYCSLEALQGVTDADQAMPQIVGLMRDFRSLSDDSDVCNARFTPEAHTTASLVQMTLMRLCSQLPRPLVLLFDESDCLAGPALITFLRQLRAGFVVRSPKAPFPWALALVGMRDIRDFKAELRPGRDTLGSASPFNIVTESLTLVNFTEDEIARLYAQHTEATGQVFEADAVARAYYWTEGQPWLVNALARQVVEKDLDRDYSRPVIGAMIDAATDTLMKRRDTHIDSLLERLREPRIRRVIEPVLYGGPAEVDLLNDDTRYCLDLGLVVPERWQDGRGYGLRPANPIYRDVMVRALTYTMQDELSRAVENRWVADGRIDMSGLLKAFQSFWRENAEAWVGRYDYKEAAPHLILQAFLQRIVNGGARIEREFALGRGRVDLCVDYGQRRYPIELKLAGSKAKARGLEQTAGYMERCGAKEGWLVIFDREAGKPWSEKITWSTEHLPNDKTIHIAGC